MLGTLISVLAGRWSLNLFSLLRGALTVFGIWYLAHYAWWRLAPVNKRLRADNRKHQAELWARLDELRRPPDKRE